MIAPEDLDEHTPGDRLLIDVLYGAILRIKGAAGADGVAPTVVIVTLAVGDSRRLFANIITPLARLIDYPAARYNILFIVSAGNIGSDLAIPEWINRLIATGCDQARGLGRTRRRCSTGLDRRTVESGSNESPTSRERPGTARWRYTCAWYS